MVGAIDFAGGSSDGYRELVATGPEVGVERGLGDLPHDGAEDWVAWHERDAALDLDFEDSRISTCVVGMYDNVVERMPLGRPLKFDAVNRGTGQAARFRARQ